MAKEEGGNGTRGLGGFGARSWLVIFTMLLASSWHRDSGLLPGTAPVAASRMGVWSVRAPKKLVAAPRLAPSNAS